MGQLFRIALTFGGLSCAHAGSYTREEQATALASCLQVTVIRDGGVLPLPLWEFLSKVDEIRLSANFNAHCMLVTHHMRAYL